jgi:small acid-soluble spore protein I (minor)
MNNNKLTHIILRKPTSEVHIMVMNSLNLRQAIVQRVKDKTNEELLEVIDGSVGNDERSLPGLGVLFEIIWQHIDEKQQLELVTALNANLK